jgi:cysteinyl-tRNA synthetase
LNTVRAASDAARASALAAEMLRLAAVLGILRLPPEQWFRAGAAGGLSDAEIEKRIAARLEARKAKNWAESDRIRKELAAAGVILEDKPDGTTTWRRG